jgi:magnesium transporter
MIEYFYKHDSKHVVGEVQNYLQLENKIKTKDFVCFLVQNPDESEIAKICKDYKLDDKPFKKFRNETRSLRYDFNPLTFTFTDYYTTNDQIKISHLLFIVSNNLLILVSADSSNYYKELFKKVLGKAEARKKYSTGYVLYEFLNQDVKENYDVIENMDDKLSLLEHRVLNDNHEKLLIHDIISSKKELIHMSKRLWASSKIIFTIKKDLTSINLNKEDLALLDDIYDTFIHQIDLIETQKETITDYFEIYTTMISNRLAATSNELNLVMKKMTALTIIIMVPTFIAGVYGTNFVNLPEIHWKYGYWLFWAVMAASAYAIYSIFHKKGWV